MSVEHALNALADFPLVDIVVVHYEQKSGLWCVSACHNGGLCCKKVSPVLRDAATELLKEAVSCGDRWLAEG